MAEFDQTTHKNLLRQHLDDKIDETLRVYLHDGDEALARAIYAHVSGDCDPDEEGWLNYSIDGDEAYGEPKHKEAYLALARSLRAALTPVQVPEIPEGWRLHQIASVAGHTPVNGFGVVGYNAYLRQNIFSNDPEVSGYGPTWQAALAAACEQAQEGGE